MPNCAFRLPEDRPLDEAGRKRFDERRLAPVIDALQGLLQPHLAPTASGRNSDTPPRIGVMGGLGQGKSTVVRCCLERLEQGQGFWQRLKCRLLGQAIARFDVSFFKTDDLEWRFVSAVLWQRILHNFLWQGPLLLLLLLGLVCLIPLLQYWSVSGCWTAGWVCVRWLQGVDINLEVGGWILGLSSVLLAAKGIGTATSTSLAFSGADKLYLAYWDLLVHFFARFTSALPRVVVIDDLDRASVEQQRGFLRAMARFSRELDFAVVVCMDDSELLAAPSNPETPEELLRKTLTDELRLPDRSREDVAMLAMICLRELAERNPDHRLAPALRSVQFVADVTRVLLLADSQHLPAPTSPRKINRMLARVVRHAAQLNVTQVDDLSALLRIDGLFQLAPGLRRQLDDVRQVLESNRSEVMAELLVRFDFSEVTKENIQRYFQRTAMMQPKREDGWFSLLGGFVSPKEQITMPQSSVLPWSVSWRTGERSHDFLRLFLDAASMKGAGYERNLGFTDRSKTADGGSGYTFCKIGGSNEDFAVTDLPEGFLAPNGDYQGQGWLCWICAITTATPADKPGLFDKAYTWCRVSGNGALRQLFWRECLADREYWQHLPERMRDLWWDRAYQETPTVPLEYFFAHTLLELEFSEAWSLLVTRAAGEVREARRVLNWLRFIVPVIRAERLLGGSCHFDTVSLFWPVPSLPATCPDEWKSVFLIHVQALNRISAQKQQPVPVPGTVMEAWRRVQDDLSLADTLDILFALACDGTAESGLRWGWRAPRLWLEALEPKRLVIFRDVVEGRSPLSNDLLESSSRCLTLLLIAALMKWQPSVLAECSQPLLSVEKDVQEAGEALENAGLLPDWWPK